MVAASAIVALRAAAVRPAQYGQRLRNRFDAQFRRPFLDEEFAAARIKRR